MAATGVLEQLCMSPHGLAVNFLAQTVVGRCYVYCLLGRHGICRDLERGGDVALDTIPILALLALTFFNLVGFGFMVGRPGAGVQTSRAGGNHPAYGTVCAGGVCP